jgi:hypothetical protein
VHEDDSEISSAIVISLWQESEEGELRCRMRWQPAWLSTSRSRLRDPSGPAIWKGIKSLLDAIDQRFGYSTWRDTKLALSVDGMPLVGGGPCAGLTLRSERRVLLVGAERGRAGGATEDAW